MNPRDFSVRRSQCEISALNPPSTASAAASDAARTGRYASTSDGSGCSRSTTGLAASRSNGSSSAAATIDARTDRGGVVDRAPHHRQPGDGGEHAAPQVVAGAGAGERDLGAFGRDQLEAARHVERDALDDTAGELGRARARR